MAKTTFSIRPKCTQCGHSANLFFEDEAAARELKEFLAKRSNDLWASMMTRRLMISWGVSFAIGLLIGRLCR